MVQSFLVVRLMNKAGKEFLWKPEMAKGVFVRFFFMQFGEKSEFLSELEEEGCLLY